MENQNYDELFRKSLLTIKKLKQQIEEKSVNKEKVAVIGMACRFPGGSDTPENYWSLLDEGRTSTCDIPKSRFDITDYYNAVHGKPGKMYVKQENFLTQDISEFDGRFFGISNLEANEMDPQHRFLYEVSWEALENAGLNVKELKGSKTGVFLGISSSGEYSKVLRDPTKVNQYTGTGTTSCIASGRISYTFGWNGPSVSLDTACSSSLVSTHLAANSLINGECDLAVSAGVSLMISPEVMSSLCSMNALAEDGKSKPFDEAANGYGRGEGCGVVVLKRLSDAVRDNDTIYAVIEGSAVNNDGESSNLTVPNGNAQQQVIKSALENAGVSPDDIDYIETHGTGTLLGDPIEFDAIKSIFLTKNNKRSSNLKIGAVKGNIGHLEAAAGVAGLIKVILCLYNKRMVKIANFNKINPRIRIDGMPVTFLTESVDWKNNAGKPRRAGLSSFGFSGTNAHMVLSEYTGKIEDSAVMPEYLLHLSAKSEKTLIDIVERYKNLLETHDAVNIAEMCFTANSCREKFSHSAAFIGRTANDFIKEFGKIISLYKEKGTVYAAQAQLAGSSEGTDRLDAKRKIYKPVDENIFTACVDKMIQPKFAFVFQASGGKLIDSVKKLYEMLPSFRSKLDVYLQSIKDNGIEENFFEYENYGENAVSDLFLLAVYTALGGFFNEMGINYEIACGENSGDYAAAILSGAVNFNAVAGHIINHYNNQAGKKLDLSDISRPSSRYLAFTSLLMSRERKEIYNYLTEEVYSQKGSYQNNINNLYSQGYRFFLDFGDNKQKIKDILNKDDVVAVNILNDDNIMKNLLSSVAECIALGSEIDWHNFYKGMNVRKIILPNYPFEKAKHWVAVQPKNSGMFEGLPLSTEKFEARAMNLPLSEKMYKFVFSLSNFPEVMDNSGVIHMGYYLEMIQNVMSKEYPNKAYVIENMEFTSALMLMEDEVKEVIILLEEKGNKVSFRIFNKNVEQKQWNQNMKGSIKTGVSVNEDIYSLNEFKEKCSGKHFEEADFYAPLEKEKGFYFGHAVRWVESATCGEKCAYIKFRHIDGNDICLDYNIKLQPGILDSCAQACNFISIEHTPKDKKYMVNRMEKIRVYQDNYTDDELAAYVTFKEFNEKKGEIKCGVLLFNAIGEVIVEIGEISLKEFDEAQLGLIKMMMENTNRGEGKDTAFLMQYMQASVEKKKELILQYIIAVIANILEEKPENLDPDGALDDLGLDSMTGLDFYNKITEQLGVEMPFSQLAECASLADCAEKMFNKLQGIDISYEEDDDADSMSPEKWIYNYKENRNVKARIFCFPNGFRSADMFDTWQEQLGDEIQVCAIQIPGMDMKRIKEKAPEYVDEFSKTLVQVLQNANLLDVPCTTFGHSWGSLFSYRLGYYLNKLDGSNYKKLFVSGFTSPSIKNSSVVKLLEGIEKQGFRRVPTYDEIKNDKAAVDLMVQSFRKLWGYDEKGTRAVLSMLLAACVLIDRYEFNPEEKMTVPIVAFHGIDDYVVKIEEMNQWAVLAADGFNLVTMKGDHQFVNENQSEKQLLEKIKEEIYKII